MNILIENNCISEMKCGSNIAYVLNDNSSFLSTEYKMLQSRANDCFVKCMKMLYNGKVQLYYKTSQYKNLSSLLISLDADSFMVIATNLIADIIDVKNNGFLSCRNIDISFEHIYVEPSTYKVSLIYLPVAERLFEDSASFENELRTSLIKLIQCQENLNSNKTMQFISSLSNGAMSLEAVYIAIKSGKTVTPTPTPNPVEDNVQQSTIKTNMKIVALNAPERVEIEVTKNEFVIGKKAESVDGLITFNKAISRMHCKINRNGTQFSITDLQSANGTYVNHVKLLPNQMTPVKQGDIIRLANSDFQVVIE